MAPGSVATSVLSMRRLERSLSAFPDAAAAAVFLSAWVAPLWWHAGLVRALMLVMLVEFILIHAGGFFAHATGGPRVSRLRRVAVVIGLAAFYLLFIGAFAMAFGEWWPLLALAWLACGKLAQVVLERRDAASERQRQQSLWILSCVAYIGGVMATTLIPVPRLGIGRDIQPLLELPGGGLWVEQPQRVIAFGLLYFGLLAWVKYTDYDLSGATTPGAVRKR